MSREKSSELERFVEVVARHVASEAELMPYHQHSALDADDACAASFSFTPLRRQCFAFDVCEREVRRADSTMRRVEELVRIGVENICTQLRGARVMRAELDTYRDHLRDSVCVVFRVEHEEVRRVSTEALRRVDEPALHAEGPTHSRNLRD